VASSLRREIENSLKTRISGFVVTENNAKAIKFDAAADFKRIMASVWVWFICCLAVGGR